MTHAISGAATTPFTAPPVSSDVLSDALGRIITGRPLPDALRPRYAPVAAPASAHDGIARILAGPGAASR